MVLLFFSFVLYSVTCAVISHMCCVFSHMCVLSYVLCSGPFSCVQLFPTLWTVAHQAHLSMGFSRQENWSGLLCPSPGGLPNLGMEPVSLMSPTLAGGFFTTSTTWEAQIYKYIVKINFISFYLFSVATRTFFNLLFNWRIRKS